MAAPIAVYVQTGMESEIGPDGSPGKHNEKGVATAGAPVEGAGVRVPEDSARTRYRGTGVVCPADGGSTFPVLVSSIGTDVVFVGPGEGATVPDATGIWGLIGGGPGSTEVPPPGIGSKIGMKVSFELAGIGV